MNPYLSRSVTLLFAAAMAGCANMPTPEATPLKCGETKKTIHNIPTTTKPVPVDVSFTMACEAGGAKFVEINMDGHPWGIGMTMPRSVGDNNPKPYAHHYEKIPCANNAELKFKWADMEEYDHFANLGGPIININNARIDARFREDFLLRYYMLNSAKNICDAAPR